MEVLRDIVLQEMNELRFNRKHIDKKIREEIETNPDMRIKVEQGVALLMAYKAGTYYASKMRRIAQLDGLDLPGMVMDLFVGIAYFQIPELYTSVTAQLASRLGFDDKTAAITTVAEILAVLCQTDAFDITKGKRNDSLVLVSRIPLSSELLGFVENSNYLPPMVCTPLELTNNYSSGYLTHKDSLVLGSGNHHEGDLCLDVLNTMNQVALKLDTAFLCTVEEEPTFALDTREKADQWAIFKKQSYAMYALLTQQGNKFYLTHKVDKRGRIYACGYHINTQGTSFKKASLEFVEEELVEGVPDRLRGNK